MNAYDDKMVTLSQYGNILMPSKDVAMARGSGNYNPGPRWQQSTNRGPAFSKAYESSGMMPNPNKADDLMAADLEDAYKASDELRKRAYVVGNTGFHTETEKWTTPEFEGVDNRYEMWALRSLVPGGMTPTPLIKYLFSIENVNYIQERIKSEITKHTGHQINNQSIDEILVIMRSTLLYAYSGWLPNKDKNAITDRGEKNVSLEDRLTRINKSIIEEAVKQVLSGINQYKQYTKDISSLPMPLSMPVYTSMSGSRTVSENIGFNSGHERTIAANSYNMRFNII
jgi:hypothetical protein